MKKINEQILNKLRKRKIGLNISLYYPETSSQSLISQFIKSSDNTVEDNDEKIKIYNCPFNDIEILSNIIFPILKNLIIEDGIIPEPDEILKVNVDSKGDKYVILEMISRIEYEITDLVSSVNNVTFNFKIITSKNIH